MRALVLQHVPVEGPGTLASYLDARGWTLETAALYEGARLPEDAKGYQAVIVMGGPMGVYDEAEVVSCVIRSCESARTAYRHGLASVVGRVDPRPAGAQERATGGGLTARGAARHSDG
jgi:GMP synthase-like glutamine amidotransferase